MKNFLFLVPLLTLLGCTSVTVRQPDPQLQLNHVLIRNNPKVIVEGFVDVMRDGFDRHGITSEIIPEDAKVKPGDYVVNYTARRSWDMAPYLSLAEIRIEESGRQVASAEYHLKGKGGFSMLKWQSVETKMTPVMDQLLAGVSTPKKGTVAKETTTGTNAPAFR